MTNQPINDKPLLMKRKDVERVIADQIRQLQEKQAIVENVRNELTFEENEQARNFQESVMDALRTIHSSILTLQEDQRKRLELFHEHKRIANNASFAESIQLDEDAYDDEPRYWQEQEIAHLERRIDELDDMISVLESAKKCEPRAFVEGVFHEEERRMQCVFCEAIGQHYSDSCGWVRRLEERKNILRTKQRCFTCLERRCSGDQSCPKYWNQCHHCM